MFDIVFLGTSASAPSIYRGLSSQAILAGEDRFLVDCGEGTQRQILRSGIGFKKLNRILLTHSHLDHILGLGGLVSTFTRWESLEELFFYGSAHTLERVRSLIYDVVMPYGSPQVPLHFTELDRPMTIYEGNQFDVQCFPVTHRGPGCFGYIFQEHDHRPFLAEKADELGVPFGPERGRLVKGESVTLDDGRVITPDMMLGETIVGTKVVITGDIARLDNIVDYVANADVLITEATFLDSERDEANSFGHITAKQAGEFAHEMNVKHLLLTHISRRYREFEVVKEARETFPDSYVVRDLDHFSIRRGQSLQKVEPE
ncbi:MAG: ribonuclease Z [Chloroflexota bacterium]